MSALRCILLIDDSPAARYLHASLIGELDLTEELLTTNDGKEGLDLFEQRVQAGNPPDMVLLDIKMPVMDGFDFLEIYLHKRYHEQCPTLLVVLTTSNDPRDVRQLQQMGIAQFVPKPLSIEDLKALTALYLARNPKLRKR